jgi:hypothetical protein
MILKVIGSAMIMIAALVISKEYKAFITARVERLSGYLELLSHIERVIGVSMTPQHRICEGFSHPALEEEFLPRLRKCGELSSAYGGMGVGVSDAAHKILSSYFSDFGGCDRSGELIKVREAKGRLQPILAEERQGAEKSIKLFETVAAAIALGLIILLI